MNIVRTLAGLLFVVSIPVFLVTTNLRLAVSEIRLYEYGFEKYGVSQVTDIERNELLEAARELIYYFNSGEEIGVQVVRNGEGFELFNEREVAHLKEVKGLIQICYYLQEAALGYIVAFAGIGYLWKKEGFLPWLAKNAIWGSTLTIILLAMLGMGVLIGFDQLFLQFHLLFFPTDTWQLNPATDYLIMMFPEGFFYDATFFIAGAAIVEALIIGGAGVGFLLRERRRGACLY